MKFKWIVTLVLAIVVSVPSLSMGESTHYFDCTECHMSGVTLNELGSGNVCVRCHTGSGFNTTLNAGSRYNSTGTHLTKPNGNFDQGDCSDVYNSGVVPAAETSHHWAVSTTVNAAAGSKEPSYALYRNMYSRYGTSTGKVTCTRCHDPHGKFDTNPKLLRLSNDNVTPMTENELCEACHSDFVSMGAPSYNGLMTHPIMNATVMNAAILDNPAAYNMAGIQNYNSAAPYTNSAVLVDGGISCSSCHGPHFTDSNSSTSDGPGASGGDGLLLRSGGPTRTGVDRNETAQLRSDLCQTCHTYQLHGKASEALPVTTGVNRIGCLDCHGGHNYNSVSMSDFVLSYASPDAPPTRVDRATVAPVNSVTFPVFSAATLKRSSWSDDAPGSANGFCEQCHGDINQSGTTLGDLGEHSSGAESCVTCHPHDNATHSFGLETSGAICGNCHGFPPYKSVSGDKNQVHDPLGEDGGYAINIQDGPPVFWNYYNSPGVTYYKDEATTGHLTHAGRDYDNQYYFFGDGGSSSNCQPCHGPGAGTTNHRQPGVTESFRDVFWNEVSTGELRTGTAVLSPNYDEGTARCDTNYCHSNGLPRTGPTSASYNTLTQITPTWDPLSDGGGQGGRDFIWTSPSRCNFCHGDSAATMAPGGPNKDNSPAHIVHLNAGYTCDVCHVTTASDNSTLQDLATHGDTGGTHVNSTVEVVYNATVLNGALASDSYTGAEATNGTCSVYCHDADDTGRSADWDTDTNLACDACHADTLISSGAHTRHVSDPFGPRLNCSACHDTGADAGTHTGHIDGQLILNSALVDAPGNGPLVADTADICLNCHGYDAEVGEVMPLWNNPATTDCATCHAGPSCGAGFNNGQPQVPDNFRAARTGGHNRLAASGNYNSGNFPGNSDCDACHITNSLNHWDGPNYEFTGDEADLMLNTANLGFPANYNTSNMDLFCLNCHGSAPAHPTNSAVNTATLNIETHSQKKCVACHNVHGEETNIQMIWQSKDDQNLHDDTFGQYSTTNVDFTNNSDFTGIGAGSYDEDDNDDGSGGGAIENNSDDICAVCHSDGTIDTNFSGNPVDHNNIEGTGDHSQDVVGTDCFDSCHSVHNDPGGAFLPSGGTSCSGCHDYPPDTAAHNLHAVEMAFRTAIDTDDQTDCENCHTGASSYTYNTNDDKGNSLNHSDDTGRLGILFNSVGFTKGAGDRWTCTKACHNTDTSDGYWYTWDNVNSATLDITLRTPIDTDGLACDKCHYYADAGFESDTDNSDHGLVGDGRAEKISEISHNDHFVKNKSCGACHDIGGADYANGSPLPGPLAHIDDRTGGNRGAIYNGAAMALKDEAGSDVLPALTYNSANTCATAGGTGCHAGSTTANWDTPFDGTTNSGCLECHTVNGNPAYDPFSGLHTNTTDPTVTGNSHDEDFLDGSGGTADCITCHTASPTITADDHIDGTLDDGLDKITVYANAGYNSTTNTCATVAGCHTSTEAGTSWEYKWSTTVYNTTGAQCDNCHGRWTDWRTGVTHRMDATPQGTHGSVGYGCKDCHALEAVSGNYAFASGTDDWNEAAGETSNHGDGLITINTYNTAFVRNVGGGSDLSGCSECHAADDGTSPGQYSFTTTVWTNSSVLGDQVPITCSSCHGGTNPNAVDESNFWPDGTNVQDDSDGAKNNSGAHELHMIRLAEAVYPDDATLGNPDATLAALFTDVSPNYAGNAEARQTELCAYCHDNPGVNPGHNDDGGLPAETLASANDSNTADQGFFPLWDTNRSGSRDSADYDTTGAGSCYLSSCHFNRATDANATNYGWYAGNSTSCEICHVPDNVETNLTAGGRTHQEHVNSASLTGRDITCNDCHQTATEDVSWSPGVAPSDNHINNTYMDALSGSVNYTYNLGTDKSCNTNDCHNLGDGTAPKEGSYPWDGPPLADCSICHSDPPDTDTHPVHMASTSYVDCLNCHKPGTDPTHMDTFVTYNTTTIGNPPGDGSCTNTCHDAGGALDWQGPFTTLACVDCHNAGASIADVPTSGLHVTSNITIHDGTLGTPDGNCVNCHDAAAPVSEANHGDGSLHNAATISYTFNSATVVGYNPTTGCMAALGCHTDDGDWRRKWNGVVDEVPTGAHTPGVSGVCDNCHGSSTTFDDPTQWRWDEASNSDHTDPYASNPQGNKMDAHGGCETCHGWGHADYDQEWGAPGVNNGHGDGSITMNGPADTGAKYNVATGSCDNAGCHSPANSPDYNLQYNSGFTLNYGDFGGGSGGPCDSCHGGSGYYAPNVSPGSFPNRAGLHLEHITAMEAKGIGHSTTCTYCHGDDPGSADWHNDGTGTLPQHNAAILGYRRIIGGAIDSDGFFHFSGNEKSTCSNIDCHFDNSYTPHWYDSDNVEPGPVTNLTAVSGPSPCSVKVTYNSPGADAGLENTTAYRYDVRVSAVSAGDAANYNSATSVKVGGLPASYLKDELTEIVIDNLDHTDPSYYVAVRARDTEGKWGPIETVGPVAPTLDTEPPMFYGANKALAGDEGAAINLYWTEAEDHSMYTMATLKQDRHQQPIRYEIWLKSEVRGDLDMDDNTGYNSAILWDGITTFYTGNAIELEGTYTHTGGGSTTIQNDITYQLGVRACDYHDICETNTTIVSVTPAAPNTVPQVVASYVANSGTGLELVREGSAGGVKSTPVTLSPGSPVDFYGSSVGYAVDYYVDSFTLEFTDDRTTSDVFAQLGVWDGVSTCTLYSSTAQITGPTKTTSLATFKFGAIEKLPAEGGESFCIQLTTLDEPPGNTIDFTYGELARGDASVIEQKANTIPNPIRSPSILLNGAILEASWTEPFDDGDGLTSEETPHYDIYGSNNDGDSWDYVISENHDWNDPSVEWDTQADGITGGLLAIKIRPGDGFSHAAYVEDATWFRGFGAATNIDKVAPGQVTDLEALPRPKKGTVQLRWTGPGDDYYNNGRALRYEIRYSTAPIANFNTASLVVNEPPYPEFGLHMMRFEVTDLPQAPDQIYFALKTFDEQDNGSLMSNVSTPVFSGPSCGMCHTTGPSVVESEGNHKLHGYTLADCDKCHDDGVNPASTFGLDHQDGILKMGYGPGGAVEGTIPGGVGSTTIQYYNGGILMYEDTDGFGGFGHPSDAFVSTGDGQDNGSCINFGAMGVGGCHGPAGSDPDSNSGLSEYPLFETPYWDSEANLDCGRCHGNPNRAETATGYTGGGYKKDPYGRDYDGTLFNSATKPAGVVPDQIIGAPGADNRGGWDSTITGDPDKTKYIGHHEKHLNYSFRFSKGDSCELCHYGHYKELDKLDGKHGDGVIDVQLDKAASGIDAHYNSAGSGVAGQCFGMDPYNCHPNDEAPAWDSAVNFPCLGCHTMRNDINKIGHYTDLSFGADINEATDPQNTLDGFDQGLPGNCTWCHFAGHPTDDVGGTALILPNNPQVGVTYKSGGIHLRKQPGGPSGPHSSYDTQAELCWGCHDANTANGNPVSEWGRDDGPGDSPNNNSAILPANGNVYDFGYVTTSDWTTATWSSNYSSLGNNANAYFEYKTGPIQSTHSTNITYGNSAVLWNATDKQYEESPDAVADLQCHNCHDVHNMNFAKGDNMSGNPYLRGSWLSNPYREDGAPRDPGTGNTTVDVQTNVGPVPRGGTAYTSIGGFQIDQNNGHATGPPTKGWVASTAGGLCLLCHGANGVDGMDQKTGEDLWITAGRNGHSNSALGGTADPGEVTDIFSYSDRNNFDPVMYSEWYGGTYWGTPDPSGNPAMGYVNASGMSSALVAEDMRGDGIRSNWGYGWSSYYASPDVTPAADFPYLLVDWGVTQDTGVNVNKGYHAFSCSKCHNPHASRLPKLMITNCLDTKQNTWDDQWVPLPDVTNTAGVSLETANLGMTLSNVTSAQNCHRLGDPSLGASGGTGGGWNLVTPRKDLTP